MKQIKTLVYIASDHRSGSTLLVNLLNQIAISQSVGELLNLNNFINKKEVGKSRQWLCTCNKPLEGCFLWSQVIKSYETKEKKKLYELETLAKPNKNKILDLLAALSIFAVRTRKIKKKSIQFLYKNKKNRHVGHNCFKVLDYVCEVVKKNIIIDSSKIPDQLYALISSRNKNYRIKVIHLVRDGRAVCHSRIKRAKELGKNFTYTNAIISWVKANVKIINLKSFFNEEDVLTIRYEDLCADTETVMRKVFSMLDLPFDQAALYLGREEDHNIGGSQHLFSPGTKIVLDERWKDAMSSKKKNELLFNLFGLFFNKRFGY